MVFIRKLEPKGTDRSPQEYVNALLTLTGKEYESLSFGALHRQLANALRGSKPQILAELREPSGAVKILFEDGKSRVVRRPGEA